MAKKRPGKQIKAYTPDKIRDYARKLAIIAKRMRKFADELEESTAESVEFFGQQVESGIKYGVKFVLNGRKALGEVDFATSMEVENLSDDELDTLIADSSPNPADHQESTKRKSNG